MIRAHSSVPATWTRRTTSALIPGVPAAIALIILLSAWEFAVQFFAFPRYLVPGPLDVVNAFIEHYRILLRATFFTFQAAIIALPIATILGVGIALLFAQFPILRLAFFPYTIGLQTLPIIAIAPIVIIWFGIGLTSIVIIAIKVAVFPIIITTTAGLLSTEPQMLNLFRLYRASPWQTLVKLRLRYALPYFFSGLRVAAGLAVVGAIVAEYVAGMGGNQAGLGYIIVESANRLRMAQVFAGAILAAMLGISFLLTINALSHHFLHRWHASAATTNEH